MTKEQIIGKKWKWLRKNLGTKALPLLAVSGLSLSASYGDTAVFLDELDLESFSSGWGTAQVSKSISGGPLIIAGTEFERGVGTHAPSKFEVDLSKAGVLFEAEVGVNGNGAGSVEFLVVTENGILWRSGIMRGGEPAKKIAVDLTGVDHLKLLVEDGGDGKDHDHANWAKAQIRYDGKKPEPKVTAVQQDLTSFILTPEASPLPAIHSPKVFGVRPGRPVLYTIAATGQRPMEFASSELPEGLTLDAKTGKIGGTITSLEKKEYSIELTAKNELGSGQRTLRIIVGDRICLTPPMGWNSWYSWGYAVDQEKIELSARGMAKLGLVNYGWNYVNIDDCWQDVRGGKYNAIQPNKRFPDMQGLVDEIHDLGMKVGIYSTPWVTSYAVYCGGSADNPEGKWEKPKTRDEEWYVGKYHFDENDAKQWDEWGIDFVKYDWRPNDPESTIRMAKALRQCKRDMVYSLSNNSPLEHADTYVEWSNMWRTTHDIDDSWSTISQFWDKHMTWSEHCAPGYYPDPDMLVVGNIFGWNGTPRPCRLTAWEQYSHVSLWCLFSAPLLISCPVDADLDAFTKSLLTNAEVLEINQDPLVNMAQTVVKTNDGQQVLVKKMEDGGLAVGLFNRAEFKQKVSVTAEELGISGDWKVRDLWRQKDLGDFTEKYEYDVPVHGVQLIRLFPKE